MTEEKNKFYVTTPIYYVTAKPHLGSLYSTVLADVAKRWHMLQGKKTFFLTGTDEHGQKIAQAAGQASKDPKVFVDGFIPAYKNMWQKYEIDYTYFIRTTDPDHVKAVQDWIRKLMQTGDIYKSFYRGWYCTPCETFLTEQEYEQEGVQGPLCPSCSRQTSMVSEECYFFKLSKYQDKLLEFYKENSDFITPKERLHEVINFVQSGLKDLSISRTTVKWGIPFPNDPAHVVYVWADALNNYITAIGWGKSGQEKEFSYWWPADVHILGKDIVRFHAVYWPAFLMAAGLALPKKLLVHGWIKVGEQKMSKSLGNVVDPEHLFEKYGADAVRYYLMRHMSIAQDSSFSIEELEQRIAADLANDLGNLVNRVIVLAHKYKLYEVACPANWSEASLRLREDCWDMLHIFTQEMNQYFFHQALASAWKFIHQLNSYFHSHEPWKLASKDEHAFKEVIAACSNGLYTLAIILWPVMPKKMESLLHALGVKDLIKGNMIEKINNNRWDHMFVLEELKNLFAKPEEQKTASDQSQPEPKRASEEHISIDDLTKVHLAVGTIQECAIVEQSDKMYRMVVDLGSYGIRTILAGVRASFKPDELIGKQAVFVVNLKPRKMLGMESQGMMLVAPDEKGAVSLISPTKAVANGVRLR